MPSAPSAHELLERVTIERATIADAAQLSRAAAKMFAETFADANTPDDMSTYLGVAFSEEKQRRELEDERNVIWLARETETSAIVGYVHVRMGATPATVATSGEGMEIVRLYADPSWQGHGLGARLMERCISRARETGAELLWLGVWEHNARAIAFYRKQGFRPIGQQPFMLGSDRQRDVVMAIDPRTKPA
jgi:ribosomal protein S18 acetylase RimI-like enzyme